MLDLQSAHECFFFVADWHALTTEYEDTAVIAQSTRDVVLDWIAAGVDPFRATIYKQSDIPEVAELALYFSMITPLGWLERNPTYKEQVREMEGPGDRNPRLPRLPDPAMRRYRDRRTGSSSPSAPIKSRTSSSPARSFVASIGSTAPRSAEPEAILADARRVPGPDGRKMSASYGNVMWLNDPPDRIADVVRSAHHRSREGSAGRSRQPRDLHGATNGGGTSFPTRFARVDAGCRSGALGCVEDKADFAGRLADHLSGFRERRAELDRKPGMAEEVLAAGRAKMRPIVEETIDGVREALRLPMTKRVTS